MTSGEDDEGDGDRGDRHQGYDVDQRHRPADLLGHGLGIEAHRHARAHDGEGHSNGTEEPEVADKTGGDRVRRTRGVTGSGHGEGP